MSASRAILLLSLCGCATTAASRDEDLGRIEAGMKGELRHQAAAAAEIGVAFDAASVNDNSPRAWRSRTPVRRFPPSEGYHPMPQLMTAYAARVALMPKTAAPRTGELPPEVRGPRSREIVIGDAREPGPIYPHLGTHNYDPNAHRDAKPLPPLLPEEPIPGVGVDIHFGEVSIGKLNRGQVTIGPVGVPKISVGGVSTSAVGL